MQQSNFFQPGFDEQTEAQNIERNRQYAQLLRQKSEKPAEGQMVSGHYVAPSWTQGLAQMLRAYQGAKGVEQADERQKALAEAVRGRQTEELGKFSGLMNGRPAEQLPDDQFGPARPAEKPDLAAAYQFATQAKTPGLQQVGLTGAMQMAQDRSKQEQASAQQQRVLGIIQSAGSPQAAIAAGAPPDMVKQFYESRNYGRDEVTFQDVGGEKVPVTKFGDRPQGIAPLQKTGNPFSDLVLRGPDGGMVSNSPLVGVKTDIARAGKPVVNVDARNYNTQESEQSKVYGKQLGEIRGTITQAGIDAPKRMAQLDRMDELLTGVDGGRLSPAGAELASAANSLGIKIDPKLGNKQGAEALAIEMALKMRPPGSGPMTDKDFENFLKTVPSLAKTSEGRKQISTTMRAALQRDMEAAKFSRDYAKQNGGVIDDNYFEALADFYGKNPVVTPQMPATNARGNKVFDAADAIINGGRR
jgi:hypothetical protein